eukprot:10227431-Alexandrium_andersonii.AAC.1
MAQYTRLRSEVATLGVEFVQDPFPARLRYDLFTEPPAEAFASDEDLAAAEAAEVAPLSASQPAEDGREAE